MKKYDIFISYRRNGGEFTAKTLRDKLEDLGYRVFFDVESLRSGNFNTELYSVIENCKDFIIVMSPGSLDRCTNQDDWVRLELEKALRCNKNVVPVLLRGFSFPDELPDSIDEVRFKNGIEANPQFFDAFISKLQEFLITKPPLFRRAVNNPVFKRVFPSVVALAIVAAIFVGGFLFWKNTRTFFPKTDVEKSVTNEVIYYVESHLTGLDMMSTGVEGVIDAAERYINSGMSNRSEFELALDVGFKALENCDVGSMAPSDGFIERVGALKNTPFNTADLMGMQDAVQSFREGWASNLAYFDWLTGDDCYMQTDSRLKLIGLYRNLFEKELKSNAYCSNELLLPITEKSSLSDFRNSYLPTLLNLPLSSGSWKDDADVLEAEISASDAKTQEALREIAGLVGDMNIENAGSRESLIRAYMILGLTREQAELYLDGQNNQTAESEYLPKDGDSANVLWIKLEYFIQLEDFNSASLCIDAYEKAAADEEGAAEIVSAVRNFISYAPTVGINFGVLVSGWPDPDDTDSPYQIGDIIIALDGKICRSNDDFSEYLNSLTEDSGYAYTATVLRADGQGGTETLELEASLYQASIYTRSLNLEDSD